MTIFEIQWKEDDLLILQFGVIYCVQMLAAELQENTLLISLLITSHGYNYCF